MTSEVEKMYENARASEIGCFDSKGKKYKYSLHLPFTAKKQLELIKFLMKQEDFSWTIVQQGKDTEYAFYVGYEYGSGNFKEFSEAVAGLINNLWQDLTEAEKAQIRGILK